MRNFIAWLGAVIIGFVIFTLLDGDSQEIADPYILGLIGLTVLSSGFVMLIFTRMWTSRGLGMMSSALGTGLIYTAAVIYIAFPETVQGREVVTDLARSFLTVGGSLWAWGIIRFVLNRRDEESRGVFDNHEIG